MRAPGGALALLAGFRQRQMREQAIGRRAMPMQRIRRDVDDIAGVQTCGFSPWKQMRPIPDRQ